MQKTQQALMADEDLEKFDALSSTITSARDLHDGDVTLAPLVTQSIRNRHQVPPLDLSNGPADKNQSALNKIQDKPRVALRLFAGGELQPSEKTTMDGLYLMMLIYVIVCAAQVLWFEPLEPADLQEGQWYFYMCGLYTILLTLIIHLPFIFNIYLWTPYWLAVQRTPIVCWLLFLLLSLLQGFLARILATTVTTETILILYNTMIAVIIIVMFLHFPLRGSMRIRYKHEWVEEIAIAVLGVGTGTLFYWGGVSVQDDDFSRAVGAVFLGLFAMVFYGLLVIYVEGMARWKVGTSAKGEEVFPIAAMVIYGNVFLSALLFTMCAYIVSYKRNLA